MSFFLAVVPQHVETVCCFYHKKNDFISEPNELKKAEYLLQRREIGQSILTEEKIR